MKTTSALLVIIICFFACRKNDTNVTFTLPQKTQSGQNTFGFLFNTAVWTNYGQVCFPFSGGCRDNLKGMFYRNDGDVSINADRVLYKEGKLTSSESFYINEWINF